MDKNRITFIGTESPVSARAASAGNCLRVVNLRHRNGSLQPVGEPQLMYQLPDPSRKLVYVHVCNNTRHHISYNNRNIYHEYDFAEDGTKTTVNQKLTTLDDDFSSISSLGNTLIVVCPRKIIYLLYKGNKYITLGDRPPMPTITFREFSTRIFDTNVPEYNLTGEVDTMTETIEKNFASRELGYYYKIRENAYSNFRFTQPIAVRYALRLYDGSHILPSPPIVLCHRNLEILSSMKYARFHYLQNDNTTLVSTYTILLYTFILGYRIENIDLENWCDIVKGIDIFVTKEVPLFSEDAPQNTTYTKENDNVHLYTYYTPLDKMEQIGQTLLDETLYYKLASIENLQPDSTGIFQEIKHSIRPDDIIYQQRLTVDTTNFGIFGARQSYIYNNRLHLADIVRQYYEGYPATLFQCGEVNDDDIIEAGVYIRTTLQHPDGSSNSVLWRGVMTHFTPILSPMLSYPDYNATSMEIVIRHEGYEYRKTFALKSIANENRASYLDSQLKNINVFAWEKRPITDEIANDFPSQSESITLYHHNRMNVSEIDNPFFFPAELTYTISGGTITGIATTIAALSQGQYGEFPLYIFTNEGIWAMQIGDGEVCYARNTPINREIVRPNTDIVSTENAVIYATDKGLSMINGANSSIILSFTSYPERAFENLLPSILPDLSAACADNRSIPDFFAGDFSLGYLHTKDELIFCNSAFNYSLVLHLPTQHIYRLSKRYITLLDGYNALLAQNSNGLVYDLYHENPVTTQIALITRPIGDGSDSYLRLRQVAWRMHGSNLNATLAITGSHEPEGSCGTLHKAIYRGHVAGHVPIRLHASPYKYYRLLLSGWANYDFHIDCADLAIEPCKNNKLR